MEMGDAVDATNIYISPDVHWLKVICCFGEEVELKTEEDFIWREEDDWRILTLKEIGVQILGYSLIYIWVDEGLTGYIYSWDSDYGWVLHSKTMGCA